MNSTDSTFGSQNAHHLHDSSLFSATSTRSLNTVADLLNVIAEDRPDEPISMFRTTADHLSNFAGVAVTHLTIELMGTLLPGFRNYLEGRKFARNTVNAYCGYSKSLLRLALDVGWVQPPNAAKAAWAPILARMRFPRGSYGIVTYAIAKGKTPSQLTDRDLLDHSALVVSHGRTNSYAYEIPLRFRKAIEQAGLRTEFPQVSATVKPYYWGIRVSDMPEPLRLEVRSLLRWKQDRLVEGRPQKMRISPATARLLEGAITRIYGYAVKHYAVEHPEFHQITRILDFANKEVIGAYLDWEVNDRHLKGISFSHLHSLIAAIKQHPAYKGADLSWYAAMRASIPEESDSELEDRRASKSLPYDVLSAIPGKIAHARKQEKSGTVAYARLVHDQLILEWFVTFAWRQRNVRECRIGTEVTGNLFKAVVNTTKSVAKSQWIEDAWKKDPATEFWQIRFRAPSEVKGKRDIRGYVPLHVVQLLEEYLQYHRPLLVGDRDPGTLFLNRVGGCMTQGQVNTLIGNLTVRYGGRRVTPHHFRDAFALAWLDDHPEDYLTLSRALWHKTVEITIQRYGRNYDESYGLRKAGDWIGVRRQT